MTRYYTPRGGLPAQTHPSHDKSVFTESYLLIDRNAFSDITASYFPHWHKARAWIIARPLSGFAESFSHYILDIAPGGGSESPEPDQGAEAALFVTQGRISLALDGKQYEMGEGGFAYLPAGSNWSIENPNNAPAALHLIRKYYESVPGISPPKPIIANEADIKPEAMPGSDGAWSTTRFVDPADLAHDMHVNIVNFEPGGMIPFDETHVMEHGLYILSGSANYRLNTNWHQVEAGDYLWLRAFCPQSCIATGKVPFRYLLYKDVNRHPKLRILGGQNTGQ